MTIHKVIVRIDRMKVAALSADEVECWLQRCAMSLRDTLGDRQSSPTGGDIERSLQHAFSIPASGATP